MPACRPIPCHPPSTKERCSTEIRPGTLLAFGAKAPLSNPIPLCQGDLRSRGGEDDLARVSLSLQGQSGE